jgi:hypothetical protein
VSFSEPCSVAQHLGFVVFGTGFWCFGPVLGSQIGATTTFSTGWGRF